jgi:hypothetical protein
MRRQLALLARRKGYEDCSIDLNDLLVRNAPATYYYRLDSGDMTALGLVKGALLVVDMSRVAASNQFVLIRHERRFLCRLMARCGSCNYTLYADLSARMSLIYGRFAPEIEVYSIDESFLYI